MTDDPRVAFLQHHGFTVIDRADDVVTLDNTGDTPGIMIPEADRLLAIMIHCAGQAEPEITAMYDPLRGFTSLVVEMGASDVPPSSDHSCPHLEPIVSDEILARDALITFIQQAEQKLRDLRWI